MSSAASRALASCATFQLHISGWLRKVYLQIRPSVVVFEVR